MDEALELGDFLPLSFKTQSEQDYIAFLWDAFESNYRSQKYQFAFLAYHMLTMSFVYFKIWQIRQTRRRDFENGLIGLPRDESTLLSATSPFNFSSVGERSILRFFRLVECNNSKIGAYAALVDDRNKTAHPNGNILYSTEQALERKITEVLRVVNEIHLHSRCVIEELYRDFLLRSQNPEDREYPDDADQVREVLIHENYISQRDIDACLAVDLAEVANAPQYENIRVLHDALRAAYSAGA